jgi:hypothetical protein
MECTGAEALWARIVAVTAAEAREDEPGPPGGP